MSSSSDQLHFSVDEIAKIMTALKRHSNEDPCIHTFDEIMREAFDMRPYNFCILDMNKKIRMLDLFEAGPTSNLTNQVDETKEVITFE